MFGVTVGYHVQGDLFSSSLFWGPFPYIGCLYHEYQRVSFTKINEFVVVSYGEARRKVEHLPG